MELVTRRDGTTEIRLSEPVWQCFYCGEVCTGRTEAENHFGLEEWYGEGHPAACVDPLRHDEKERMAEVIELHRELNGERDENSKLSGKVEGLEYALHLWSRQEPELIRRLKGNTLSDALHNLESIEGRLLTAEAYVAELKARDPALWQAIQDHICRPLAAAEGVA